MAAKLKAVNPDVLEWAHKRSGRSIEEVADAFNKDVSVIEEWESENRDLAPTYGQLEKLAYELD